MTIIHLPQRAQNPTKVTSYHHAQIAYMTINYLACNDHYVLISLYYLSKSDWHVAQRLL